MPQNRIIMNSQSLQEKFPEIYQDLFSKCPIICSTPRSFTWFGGHSIRYENMTLRQNLPLKTYVGLIPNKKQTIKIINYINFDPNTQKFQKETLDPYTKEKIEKHFLAFLKRICNIKTTGFNIYILNELPPERGLGSGALITSLMAAALALNNKLTSQDILNWRNKNTSELKESKFDYLFKNSWKWENFLYPGASGSNLINILPTSTPILYFSKRSQSSQSLTGKKIKLNELNFIDQSSYWTINLNKIIKDPSGWPLPFDYGLIYTGEIKDIHNLFAIIQNLKSHLAQDIKECKKDLENYLKKEQLPSLFKICQNSSEIWQNYTANLSINAIRTYTAFKEIFENGFSSNSLKKLAESLNKEQYLFQLLNPSSPTLDNLLSSFKLAMKKFGQEDIITAAKMAGGARRGDVLFIANSHQIRNKIDQIIDKLKEKFGTDINLDYASWLDDDNKEKGLKIEQHWQKGIFSKYIKENTIIQKNFSPKETTTQLLQEEKINKEKVDLLLDDINHKIFIKGKKVTSKQLPSQKTAIEILKILLEIPEHCLFNDELPRSSYSTNRNDMQGKIIGPLKKLIKKHTKKDLDLKTNGTLTRFYLKMNQNNIKISLIDKIT